MRPSRHAFSPHQGDPTASSITKRVKIGKTCPLKIADGCGFRSCVADGNNADLKQATTLNAGKAMTELGGPEPGWSSMITREEILARLTEPSFVLVNVMPKETFQDGHIPRSINLPLSDIETKARQFFPDLGAELVIYCGGPT